MKKIKIGFDIKIVKRLAGIAGAVLIFWGISAGLNYMYVRADGWGRPFWHYYYTDDNEIDNVYLGSSHVYHDINSVQLNEINGKYNYNMASGEQVLNGAYYLLKEADKDNMLSQVYLEVYYLMGVKNNFNSDSDPIEVGYIHNWKNTDYMKWSYNKLEYMLSMAGAEHYVETFLPFCRYRAHIGDWDYIKQTIENKQRESYRAYEYSTDNERHLRQGFYSSTRVFPEKERFYRQSRILEENPMGEISEKYLRKIIEYCRKKEYPIMLFVSPIDDLQLISTENYDNYINQIRSIAQEYELPFYDFNLAKEEYLPIHKEEYFYNIDHLNAEGADIFTPFFWEVVSGDAAENEKYFYLTYAEKLADMAPAIYGIYYRSQGQENKCMIASNREKGLEYKVTRIPVSDEWGGAEQMAEEYTAQEYIVQGYMENKEFTLPADEHGICRIEMRIKNGTDNVQVLEVDY